MPFGNTHYRIKLNNWKKASESNIVSLFELKKKKTLQMVCLLVTQTALAGPDL